jgi:hypothetical protein
VLVIGGGVGRYDIGTESGRPGFQGFLVERPPWAAWPDRCAAPWKARRSAFVADLIEKTKAHDNIR